MYEACVLSSLLYDSKSWTLHSNQERKLSSFHILSCSRCVLGTSWREKIPNNTVLETAGITSSYNLLKQRRVRWLDLVSHMEDGRILKDFLDGELAAGKRPTRRHQLALQGPL